MEEPHLQWTLMVVGLRVTCLGLGWGLQARETVTLLQRGVGLGWGLCNFSDTKSLPKNSNLGVPIVAHWKLTCLVSMRMWI